MNPPAHVSAEASLVENDNEETLEEIVLNDRRFSIFTAENDFNSDKKTLFATMVFYVLVPVRKVRN